MRIRIRKIGNSLGVIVPRELLAAWGTGEGALLEAGEAGIWPRRRRAHGQAELDELKRRIAIEVVALHRPEEIRRSALANLAKWKASGAWCGAYEEWQAILERGNDEELYGAMLGTSDRSNRLRQSMPYVGMIPQRALHRLREEVSA